MPCCAGLPRTLGTSGLLILLTGLTTMIGWRWHTAHPRWIVEAYADVLEPSEVEQALAVNNFSPEISLAVRPGLAEVSELVDSGARSSPYSPFGARWRGDPADLALVRNGRVGVQDEGSQLVTWALTRAVASPGWWLVPRAPARVASRPDRQVWRVRDTSRLLAADVAPHRAKLVAAAVRGYAGGGSVPAVVVADSTRPAWRVGSFARVLADVPCSGLGALRVGPNRAGAADLPTWCTCMFCSGHCLLQRSTVPRQRASWATSRAHHIGAKPATY